MAPEGKRAEQLTGAPNEETSAALAALLAFPDHLLGACVEVAHTARSQLGAGDPANATGGPVLIALVIVPLVDKSLRSIGKAEQQFLSASPMAANHLPDTRATTYRLAALISEIGSSLGSMDSSATSSSSDSQRAKTNPAPSSTKPFIPTQFQERILRVLDAKALTARGLAAALRCDMKQLYRSGLNELKREGKVLNNRRVGGYYRPDAPPERYAQLLSAENKAPSNAPIG